MENTLFNKVVDAIKQAEQHNSGIMVKPEVILWPDPERQWESVISILQNEFPFLLVFGDFEPSKKQGPAIWIKCMVAHLLPEAKWPKNKTPIIYLPGLSKNDLKNITVAGLDLQPIMEYQYTGTIFTQLNGREWTVLAFMENELLGLGLKVSQDKLTRDTLVKVLPTIFQDSSIKYPSIIDIDFLNSLLFPDVFPSVLKWLCKGDSFINSLSPQKKDAFKNICLTRFNFEPDYKNIKAIVEKFGMQNNAWKHVWELFASSPQKYPELIDLLRVSKPDDMGVDLFAVNKDSWPQVNEEMENELYNSLKKILTLSSKELNLQLIELENKHSIRRNWVWSEFGFSPLANALPHLLSMTEIALKPFPFSELNELKEYYVSIGYQADQSMRKALVSVKSQKDRKIIIALITNIYKPWLESITVKFQKLIDNNPVLLSSNYEHDDKENYILFVDAFRFEVAKEFIQRMEKLNFNVELKTGWSAIPSLTPTSKPLVSPISDEISLNSNCIEFRPQLKNGKDLQIAQFREELNKKEFKVIVDHSNVEVGKNHWQEIGEIDKKGHEEQSGVVKRIDELFDQIQETIDNAFEKGIKKIKIVTDHGWLLLPGGLPKVELNKNLTETRWGRCALIKDDANVELQHLPWKWNPNIFIAYAPGISFFKKNEEYAHGGISLHECLVPIITIENKDKSIATAKISDIKWVGLNCKITTIDASEDYLVDIRTNYTDSKSSIVLSNKEKKISNNKISLMVDDDAESKSAIVVLMDKNERILDKKPTLVGS